MLVDFAIVHIQLIKASGEGGEEGRFQKGSKKMSVSLIPFILHVNLGMRFKTVAEIRKMTDKTEHHILRSCMSLTCGKPNPLTQLLL